VDGRTVTNRAQSLRTRSVDAGVFGKFAGFVWEVLLGDLEKSLSVIHLKLVSPRTPSQQPLHRTYPTTVRGLAIHPPIETSTLN
jgi:hypothetical protein